MKVLLSWLNDYVTLDDLTADQVAEKLTFSGVEVEGIERVGHDYAGMVVGEVREITGHPNADRLTLCKVFDGREEQQVVCGASNFTVGDKAAFAPAGTSLADGTRLRKAKIRGQASNGMLLAEDELGLSDDHGGIVLFERSVAPGTPLPGLLPGPDFVLLLEITWNRPDCLCLIGIARELAALLGRPLKLPDLSLDERLPDCADRIEVVVEDQRQCLRYTARILEDVCNRQAPMWMRQRLLRSGIRSIGGLVDVTNYVMLESGQPLHAFDLPKLKGGRVVVRPARDKETIVTLDGECRRLSPAMLVIADAEKAVAVAGVMGGADSEVGDQTGAVLLESASFSAPGIKQTAYSLGLQTESSHRFERGVDPDLADWASRRAAGLMARIAGGVLRRGSVDVHSGLPGPRRVRMRYQRARQVSGLSLTDREMAGILESLDLGTAGGNQDYCEVLVPGFRPDLVVEADLIEEVARIHGLDRIAPLPASAPVISGADAVAYETARHCRQLLVGLGFTEAMHYSFDSAAVAAWDAGAAGRMVSLPNPVSADYAVLRFSLLPQMVETLGRNHARQVPALAMFEIGRVFEQGPSSGVAEKDCLSMGLYGPVGRDPLDQRRPVTRDEAFFWLKGAVEALCERLNGVRPGLAGIDHDSLEEGFRAALVLDGKSLGVMGLVKPGLLHCYRLHTPMAVAEINTGMLMEQPTTVPPLRSPPEFPSVTRDVALVAEGPVSHSSIERLIRQAAPAELTSLRLFDIFKSSGKASVSQRLAYSLEYRSDTRTLTDEEVNGMHQRVIEALRSAPGVEIRDR